jgi:hypothetical protein
MEVIIHGTKGGYKVLYQTENVPFSIARDVRRIDRNDGNPVGQAAYSIAFAEGGCTFTKYIIVRDTERAAVGNIAFSVYLHGTKKLPGKDIINLLDNLAEKYRRDYIIDGNLGNRQEDWSFVDALVDEYKKKCNLDSPGDSENFKQGTAEAAYVYFSEEELQKYFDAPDQELYFKFRQVFFVNINLKDKPENPLNALRHDLLQDLTGQIDLENTKYRLKEFQSSGKNGITIQIWANNKKVNNNDIIYKKDLIRIRYFKNNYFNSIEESGKLTDDNISNYVKIVNNNKIKVESDVKLSKKECDVLFHFKDTSGNLIFDAEIICKNESSKEEKNVINNQIKFEGEELKYCWTVYAKNGDFIVKPSSFIPENTYVPLILELKEPIKQTLKQTDVSSQPIFVEHRKKPSIYTTPGFIAGSLIGLVVIIVTIIFVNYEKLSPKNKITSDEEKTIIEYVDGVELKEESLIDFQKKYCPSNPGLNEENGMTRIWNAFFSSDNVAKNKNETETHSLGYCQKLGNALNIRKLIKNGNVDSLKKLNYSEKQEKFGEAVKGLDDSLRTKIFSTLKEKGLDVSKMNLDDIAGHIISIKDTLIERRKINDIKNKSIKSNDGNTDSNSAGSSSSTGNSKNQVKEPPKPSAIIDENKFWQLVKQPDVKKESFDNLFKGKKNIYEEPIKIYYNDYLISNEKFKTFSDIPIIVRERAAERKDLQILKNYKK